MSDFRFANEQWIYALWFVLLIGGLLLALEYRSHAVLEKFLSASMQSRLVKRPSRWRRVARVLALCAALTCLVLAMMRPQWGRKVEAATRVDSQIMICLDVSKSMLAEDVVPSRLERAKAEIDLLLSLVDGGEQVGLLAFAGKAAVLCPMTTDFGFLRLVLTETGPSSVGLGGTKIGQAIQKAVDGFRSPGDVNRLIILITDGEDHESFPMDAALAAKEKGIRIVSIGFGDEAGTRIEITDPQTGLRSFVTDQSGSPALSRLDGETLREIALETDGAYIPAGTGALDLDSIYEAHIASLLKGKASATEERIVRNEAFQWFVLAGLLLWLLSFTLTYRMRSKRFYEWSTDSLASAASDKPSRTAASLFLAFTVVAFSFAGACSSPALAAAQEDSVGTPTSPTAVVVASQEEPVDAPEMNSDGQETDSAMIAEAIEKLSPRASFNQAVAVLRSDPDAAEELLEAARREAGVDGELRYRAAYNLGWVDIVRADELLESEPEQTLKHLQLAASRFREAVRLRPESDEARHNLEIVGQRVLELTDQLNQQQGGELAEQLDQLIASLRGQQSQLQSAAMASNDSRVDTERLRGMSRELGVVQRQILTDAERLASRTAQSLTVQQNSDEAPTDPEEQLKLAQQTAALAELNGCINWLTKARSQTRRRQLQRAFLRWSAGLNAARRARNELLDPIERLSIIIADGQMLARQTEQKAAAQRNELDFGDSSTEGNRREVPVWLSGEYLTDMQADINQRLQRLVDILRAAVTESAENESTDATAEANAQAAEMNRIRDSVNAALPLLDEAGEALKSAAMAVGRDAFDDAFQAQLQALEKLQAAAEYFYDYRRLIEVMYRDEQLIAMTLADALRSMRAGSLPEGASDLTRTQMLAAALKERQSQNLLRSERLEQLLTEQLEKVEQAATAPTAVPPQAGTATADGSEPQAEIEKFQNAINLLTAARSQMFATDKQVSALADPAEQSREDETTVDQDELDNQPADSEKTSEPIVERPPSPNRGSRDEEAPKPSTREADEAVVVMHRAVEHANSATMKLDELRRLFFTVVERLRDAAQRQADLNDDSAVELSLQSDPSTTAEKAGPLAERQTELADLSRQIAEELEQQAQAQRQAQTQAQPGADNAAADSDASNEAAVESMQSAAELTRSASEAMDAADASLRDLAMRVLKRDGTSADSPEKAADQPVESPLVQPPEQSLPEDVAETVRQADQMDEPRTAVSTQQRLALQRLLEALEALNDQPPPQDQDQQDQQDQSQQEQSQQGNQQQPQSSEQRSMSAEQMLQAIREREAERRRDKQREATAVGSAGVEKDW